MKLTYRGVSYEYTPPPMPVVDTEELGHYRGAIFHFHKLIKSIAQPSLDLKYRGVSYHKGAAA